MFDFILRQKFFGANLIKSILDQLAVIPREEAYRISPFVTPRCLELTCTNTEMECFGRQCGYDGPLFRWNEDRRFLIRCENDAAFFHLYLGTESEWRESGSKELLEYFPTPRHAVEYIMETFPIVKRKDIARTADENGENGRYITKDTILDIYDEMAEVIAANEAARAAGQPATAQYQTRLDPPPGPPTDEAGNFIPYADWTPEIHARYANIIHPPRKAEEPAEVPRKVAVSPPTFPATERERAICATALALVGASDGISSEDHLTSLLLATHMDWCRAFLKGPELAAASAAAAVAPSELAAQGESPIRWLATREYLMRSGAITIAERDEVARLRRGPRYDDVRASLPAGVEKIAGVALSAARKLASSAEATMNERQTAACGHLLALKNRERSIA